MKKLFNVGDLVRTDFHGEGGISANAVRKIIDVRKCDDAEGGWLYTADGGDPCPTCGRVFRETPPICGAWFTLVARLKKRKRA